MGCCPRTQQLPDSAPELLGLKECTTTSGLTNNFLSPFFLFLKFDCPLPPFRWRPHPHPCMACSLLNAAWVSWLMHFVSWAHWVTSAHQSWVVDMGICIDRGLENNIGFSLCLRQVIGQWAQKPLLTSRSSHCGLGLYHPLCSVYPFSCQHSINMWMRTCCYLGALPLVLTPPIKCLRMVFREAIDLLSHQP